MDFRHWEGEAEGLRTTHQRVTAQHLGHQWYNEDYLKQRVVAPSVQPGNVLNYLILGALFFQQLILFLIDILFNNQLSLKVTIYCAYL